MSEVVTPTRKYRWLLWLARIWSLLSIGFLLFMIIGHLLGGDFGSFNDNTERLMFLFFPIGVIVGLGLAWWKSWLGGLVTIGSLLAFRLIGNEIDFNFWIDGIAAPGFLFLLYWALTKRA